MYEIKLIHMQNKKSPKSILTSIIVVMFLLRIARKLPDD